MTNINQSVTNFIDQDVSIRRGLSRGFINTRSLAKYIKKELHLNGLDAVISAIRRYDPEDGSVNVKKRYEIIASAKISSRTRMVSILLQKSARPKLTTLYSKIDFEAGQVLRVLEVTQNIKIIIDSSNMALAHDIFKNKILSVEEDVSEISVIYHDEVIATPGVFAALSSEMTLSDISIRDGIICGNEHIFVVKDKELMAALDALDRIRKWGEKSPDV